MSPCCSCSCSTIFLPCLVLVSAMRKTILTPSCLATWPLRAVLSLAWLRADRASTRREVPGLQGAGDSRKDTLDRSSTRKVPEWASSSEDD